MRDGFACWYALVDHEVVGPFDTMDPWYHEHAGPDWRHHEAMRTGIDPWRVALDEFPDGQEVSTVFLGLDHGWMPGTGPLLFETMIFPDGGCSRCATWAQAEAMHAAAVAEVTAATQG